MSIQNEMEIFLDKNGNPIKAGDTIKREFFVRMRERPGHKRVALDMMDNDVIVPDEGSLLEPEKHWITRKVGWTGACLIAERHEYSDFQKLMSGEKFDDTGKRIHEGSGFDYLNSCFDSAAYEIVEPS